MVRVSSISPAPTPASSWVVICALKPLSTARITAAPTPGSWALTIACRTITPLRSRQNLTVDTRTATEYGVVRTFFDANFTWTTGSYAGAGTGAYHVQRAQPARLANPSDGGIAGGAVGINYAFIQFAGFTMGRSVSAFDAPWVNYPANNFDGLVGGSGSTNGVNQFTYTAQFGNGVSGSLSAQDQGAYRAVGRAEPDGRYGGRYAGRVERSQQHRRHARSGSDRRAQGRPGLGCVPGCRLLLITTTLPTTAGPSHRSSRRQVGLGRAGCLADQEHPDRCG